MTNKIHLFRTSALPRLACCPGSANATEQATISPVSSEAGLEGSRLHHSATLSLAVREPDLSDEQQEAVRLCRELAAEAKRGASWFFMEHYLETSLTRFITLTGHTDFIARHGPNIVIYDYKFSWQGIQESAIWQAKGYALLAMSEWSDVDRCEVIVYAPRTDSRLEYTITRSELSTLRDEIVAILERAAEPEAELVPSNEACQYCPASYKCEALMATVRRVPHGPIDSSDMEQFRVALTLADRASVWASNVKTLARRLEMEQPGSFPGWSISTRKANRKVRDSQQAHDQLWDSIKDVMLPSDVFRHVSIRIGSLEKAYAQRYHEQTQEPRYKGAEKFKTLVAPALEDKEDSHVFAKDKKSGKKRFAASEQLLPDGRPAITSPDDH